MLEGPCTLLLGGSDSPGLVIGDWLIALNLCDCRTLCKGVKYHFLCPIFRARVHAPIIHYVTVYQVWTTQCRFHVKIMIFVTFGLLHHTNRWYCDYDSWMSQIIHDIFFIYKNWKTWIHFYFSTWVWHDIMHVPQRPCLTHEIYLLSLRSCMLMSCEDQIWSQSGNTVPVGVMKSAVYLFKKVLYVECW